ncbi:cutinase family protein [Nocardia bovistercoris]|uniref:Cutinase family protein n=1 Tax=Nocardia bovistercoris TaxID=2785916 RepID=A0A931I9Z0_9NOCA|nr:cutinase family protein [Nocardia bovistercoris]MBH0777687.1 cutinase family protein [Nocardia bovistercoris]
MSTHDTPLPAHIRRRFLRVLLCAALATATAAGTATAAPPTTPAPGSCPRWTAVLVPGTWETSPTAMASSAATLDPIATGLTARYGGDIDVRTLTTGPDTTGIAATLTATVAGLCSGTRVVAAGQARGADAVADLATTIGHHQGPIPADRVVAVGLVSDPHRDPATPQLGTPASGQGLAGPRPRDFGELADRVRTLCVEDDPYCATSPQKSPALAAVARVATSIPVEPRPTDPDPNPAPTTPTTTASPASTPTPTPTSATSAAPITGLDPSRVLAQVVTVLDGLSGFTANVPAIVDDLARLPALLGSGDIPGLHQVAGDLNNRFHPLVAMAAGIDLRLVARALTMAAPLDTTGGLAVAAEVVGLLAGLDITRIAAALGRAQEVAWTALAALAAGDPLTALLAVTDLAPVATDLLAGTASAFTGGRLLSLADSYTAPITPTTAGSAAGDPARYGGDTTPNTPAGDHTSATAVLADWFDHAIDHTR